MNGMVSIYSRSWLVHYILEKELRRIAERYVTGRLLDVGCGEKRYKELLSPFVTGHIGVDHPGCLHERSNIDVYAQAYDLPMADKSFDVVFSTAVLEHLEEPDKAIAEAARVLRIGGIAIYSVPLFWHIHEAPRDFYRFTRYGLQHLFEKNEFEIIQIQELSGFWVTFVTETLYYLEWLFGKSPVRILIPPFGRALQLMALWINRYDRSTMFTWMYLVVARRK